MPAVDLRADEVGVTTFGFGKTLEGPEAHS
jgi:hypothetical protein